MSSDLVLSKGLLANNQIANIANAINAGLTPAVQASQNAPILKMGSSEYKASAENNANQYAGLSAKNSEMCSTPQDVPSKLGTDQIDQGVPL